MKRKFLSTFLALCMVLTLVPVTAQAADESVTLTDVSGHWAERSITRWVNSGVVQGSDGQFDPNGPLTCGQLATILSKLLKLGAAGDAGFSDSRPGAWYYDAVNRCAAAGILNGNGDGTVDPDGTISRERAMVMLGRALGIEPVKNADLTKYGDGAKVAPYASGMVAAMIEAGIVSGVGDNRIAPQDEINRASTVTILDRAIGTYANEDGARVSGNGGITLVVADDVTVTGEAGRLLVSADDVDVTLEGGKTADHVAITGDNSTVTVKSTGVESASVSGDSSKLILESANAGDVTLSGAKSEIETKGTAKVDSVSVTEDAAGATVSAGKGTTIESVTNDAQNATVTGSGTVSSVKSSEDVTVETKGTDVKNTGDGKIDVTDSTGKDTSVSGGSTTTTGSGSTSSGSGSSSSSDKPSHSHRYADAWSYDADYHWHASTCGHDTVSGKEAHTWDEGTVTKEATETEKGEMTYTCTVCGYVKTAEIPELGHVHHWELVARVDATCTTDGTKAYYICSCGAKAEDAAGVYAIEDDTQLKLPKLGHTAGSEVQENVVEATCTTAGSYDAVVYCTVCKAEISREAKTTDALSHNWGEWTVTKEATETAKGEKTRACTRCDAVETEEIPELEHVHQWTLVPAVAATCTTGGKKAYYVCACGEKAEDAEGASIITDESVLDIPALGHTPGDAVRENEVAATCTTDGSYDEVVYCTVCKAEISREHKTVDALGHSWNEGVVTTEPTCTEAGEKTYKCTVCQTTKTESVAALGHEFDESTLKCTRCGEFEESVVAAIGDHGYKTLTEAMAAAENKNTIVLLQDMSESGISVKAGLTVTLDLNGKALSANSTIFYVSGTLTIKNTGDAATGSVTSNDRALYLNSGSAVTLSAGVAVHTNDRPIVVEPTATLTVAKGASVEGDPDEYNPGSVITCQGTVNIQSGSTVTGHGYESVITVDGGKLSMTGGTVEQTGLAGAAIETKSGAVVTINGTAAVIKATNEKVCPSGNPGIAAISMTGGGRVEIKNGKIEAGMKFGVDVAGGGTLTVTKGEITGSTTAVQVTKGTANLSGGTFRINPETSKQGYLLNCIDANYQDGTAKIVVTGGTYEGFDPADNSAEGEGTNFVKDGYASQADGAGHYTVAKIGSSADLPIEISTAKQALAMAEKAGYYKLVDDVVVDNEINLSSKTWVIDLNGHSVRLAYAEGVKPNNGGVFNISGKKSSLTINDSSNGEGKVIGSDKTYTNKVTSAVRVGNYGKLTINGGHFYGMNEGTSCIFTMTSMASGSKGTVVINGGTFETASPSNGIYYVLNHQDSATGGCTMTVNGGTFKEYNPGVTHVDPVNAKTGKIVLGTGCTTTSEVINGATWYTVSK